MDQSRVAMDSTANRPLWHDAGTRNIERCAAEPARRRRFTQELAR
jgi:hypothetical protein